MVLAQAMDTIRQLHGRLVEVVGSDGKAKAIEAGAVILVVLLVLIYLRGHYSASSRRRRASAKRFKELASAHGLPSADRQLLLAMTRTLELEEPGLIFVRRSFFEAAVEQGNFKPERVDVLRRELFS
jgi:hypothetical protein